MGKEQELADCVGAIYEAASASGHWLDVGDRICRLLDAQRARLRLEHDGAMRNVLMAQDESLAVYDAHFHAVDPYLARAHRDFQEARASHVGSAKVGEELVPDQALLRSAFYNDFARRFGMRYMIGGMVGVADATPIALFRGEGAEPFGAADVRILQAVLPHMQRALELGARLQGERRSRGLTLAALDALPVGVGVVDGGLKIRFVNDLARRYLAAPDAGLYSVHSGPHATSGVYLAAMSREGARRLRQLVASVVAGGSGGSLRLDPTGRAAIAVLVAPLPPQLRDEMASASPASERDGHALILLRPFGQALAPPAGTLCDLFGLSRAEEEVAMALAGGATAQEVADRRGVSLVTIRSQVRSILDKSGAGNLRDLERSMAALGALAPRGPGDLT